MQQLGRYRVLGTIGHGAMGSVYRAEDPAIGRIVAIKTIRLDRLEDPAERQRLQERFAREAKSAGRLSHPNIVTIYDAGQEGDLAYLCMEFVDGPTVDQWSRHGALSPAVLLQVLKQVATGLDYAHASGVIHRDVKPANVLIANPDSPQRIAKIADFGVAKLESHDATLGSLILGTPNYMAPEQIQGSLVDGRADQFSLAVCTYELLTGEKPFTADSMPTLLFKIVREEPLPPRQLNPSLGPEVDEVLRRAMAKEAESRYATCTEFANALEVACAASGSWQVKASVLANQPTLAGAPGVGSTSTITRMTPPSSSEPAVFASTSAVERGDTPTLAIAAPLTPATSAPPMPPAAAPARAARRGMAIALGALLALAALAVVLWRGRTAEPSSPQAAATVVAQPATESTLQVPRSTSGLDGALPQTDIPLVSTVPLTPAQRAVSHEVTIKTQPEGAIVTAGELQSDICPKTPCRLLLPAGGYKLHIRLDGYSPMTEDLQVPDQKEVLVELTRRTNQVRITSQPSGATVYIDDRPQVGPTPLLVTLGVGNYALKLVAPDGRQVVQPMSVPNGPDTATIHVPFP